jgi:hypothetical protein
MRMGRQDTAQVPAPFTVVVRCLCCGAAYRKPNTRVSFVDDPGCPRCGYLGWAEH